MSNHYQISYSIFSERIFVSYIKFNIEVWLLIVDVTAATIGDSLPIIINCMILHVCGALLFHKMHHRNIGQTFCILLTWPQWVRVRWNALHCSHATLYWRTWLPFPTKSRRCTDGEYRVKGICEREHLRHSQRWPRHWMLVTTRRDSV
jgi:hypothetical protein